MKKIKGVLFDLEGALLVPGQAEDIRRVVPGGLRVIRRLYERGYRLGILSRQAGEDISHWLREEGLMQYFDAVAPFPDFRMGCEELGLEPEECACVTGGNTAGTMAAGGLRVSRLNRGSAAGDPPDGTVQQLADLLDLSVLQ